MSQLISESNIVDETIKCIDTKTVGFYGQYTGRSIGRLNHFLYDLLEIKNADSFIYEYDKDEKIGIVKSGSALVCSYIWLFDTDVPHFVFTTQHLGSKQNAVLRSLNLEDHIKPFLIKEIIAIVENSTGIKLVELVTKIPEIYHVISKSNNIADIIQEVINKKLVKSLDYVVPNMDYRTKTLLFPKGTMFSTT